jgi:hypothetical protein
MVFVEVSQTFQINTNTNKRTKINISRPSEKVRTKERKSAYPLKIKKNYILIIIKIINNIKKLNKKKLKQKIRTAMKMVIFDGVSRISASKFVGIRKQTLLQYLNFYFDF